MALHIDVYLSISTRRNNFDGPTSLNTDIDIHICILTRLGDGSTSLHTPRCHFCEASAQCYLAKDLPGFEMFINVSKL